MTRRIDELRPASEPRALSIVQRKKPGKSPRTSRLPGAAIQRKPSPARIGAPARRETAASPSTSAIERSWCEGFDFSDVGLDVQARPIQRRVAETDRARAANRDDRPWSSVFDFSEPGLAVQARGVEPRPAPVDVPATAAAGVAHASAQIPHARRIQESFGRHDVGGVRAAVGGPAAEASRAIGAEAYATGNRVAFRSSPDLHTAAHEAAHVVQQRAGVQLAGGVGEAGDAYERHADRVADLVVAGQSAEATLDEFAGCGATSGAVQRVDADTDGATATTYTVQSGDTISAIAAQHGVTSDALTAANADKIKTWRTDSGRMVKGFNAGEVIVIPAPPEAAAPADTPDSGESSAPVGDSPEGDDSLIGAGLELASGIFDSVTGAVNDGIEAVSGLVDALLGIPDGPAMDDAEPEQGEPERAAPDGEPEVEAPAAAEPGTPEFLDQLDNEWKGDTAEDGNMCTVTSLSMQLIALFGSADAVKQEASAVTTSHGGEPDPNVAEAQTEDVLMRLFDTLEKGGYWETKYDERSGPFYPNWYKDGPRVVAAVNARKFHQLGVCQAHVLTMFEGISSDNQSTVNTGIATLEEFLLEHIRGQILEGTTFAASTELTGSGHFVTLVEVRDDGVILHDPYGARGPSGHLKNGSAPPTKQADLAMFDHRFSENPALGSALHAGEARPNWGERNFFDWDEVERWKIGKSVTSASRA